jgi:hypothetical protein
VVEKFSVNSLPTTQVMTGTTIGEIFGFFCRHRGASGVKTFTPWQCIDGCLPFQADG